MIRHITLTAALMLVTAAPALAQTHSGSHDRSRVHGPGHLRPDSATHAAMHAAMHAALHGNWTGALSSRGVSKGMLLSVAQDSLKQVKLTVSTDEPKRSGAATDLVIGSDGQLRWTQELSGARCKANAILSAATAASPEALSGKMSCDGSESTFVLHKKTA